MRTEDEYIIDRCLNGDPAAFALLVEKYKASVHSLVYSKLHNFHDAEDVTQEVFINAYENLRGLKQPESLRAWLHAIAVNLCRNWRRVRSRWPDREFIEDQNLEILEEFSMSPYREDPISELIHEAIGSLPDAHQQVLALRYLGGMNSKEIAECLGTSDAATRQRLTRARAQFEERVLTIVSAVFAGQKLKPGFTSRVIEAARKKADMPTARTYLSASAVRGKIYAIGGRSGWSLGANLTTVEEYDPATDTWAEKAGMPTARRGLSTCVVNGKIYAVGGYVRIRDCASAVEEYDPVTNTWTKKADMPAGSRAGVGAAAVDGKLYVIGGWIWNVSLSILEEYDPAADTWTRKADMPTPRNGMSVSVVNGRIYAIGGRTGRWPDMTVNLSAVEEYDPAADGWTKKADMPTARDAISACVVNEKIYAVGGRIGGWPDVVTELPTVEEYDPATDVWTKKADMPTARWGLATSAVDGKIYVIGGGNVLPTVEEYTPGGYVSMLP